MLQVLKPAVFDSLQDSSPDVRWAAVLAIGNLEFERGQPSADIRLSENVLQRFASLYAGEPSVRVRVEIIKGLARTPTQSSVRDATLLLALEDSSSEVLQQAVIGVGRASIAAAVPRVVELLKHEERAVRLSAAQSLARYGPLAASHLAQMKAALSGEPDDIVRKTLESTIALIGSGGAASDRAR